MIDFNKPPSVFRRLAVIVYDLILLVAVLFAATLLLLPFQPSHLFQPSSWIYRVYLFFISFLFYAWFWTTGGQTLGLVAWKLRVVNENGGNISWKQSLIRFITAIFSCGVCGLGIVWMLFNKEHLAWHDITSKSHLQWKDAD
ncbi:MAG: hypothetical protein A6F72_08715 [Cycloclasticus sp. symbiont of Poecilosclerida sp. N]|nr:MAG: hypothetical protein A6F72_08715 [Cycloclasticus sp. symbiont of Poecilosclerida sp. N]